MDLMERGASSLVKEPSLARAPSSSSVPKVILPPSASSLASPLVDLERSNSKRFTSGRGHNPRPSYEEEEEEEDEEEPIGGPGLLVPPPPPPPPLLVDFSTKYLGWFL